MKKEARKENLGEIRGTLLILLTAIISGVSVVINKFFVTAVDPLVLTATRALVIGIVFFFISLYFSGKTKKFKKVSWSYLILIGIIGGGIAFWLFFSGLKLTTSGRAAFIHKTLPIYATLLAIIFLKEKITRKQLIALAVMLAGLVLIELTNISNDMQLGDLLILSATVLWAIETTISKKVMLEKESNWVVTFSRMFFGALLLFAIIFLLGKTSLLFSLNSEQWLYIIVSGVLLFFYVLTFYWGLKYINLSKASTVLLLAPVISLVLGAVWLNEQVFALQLVGSMLILIGTYFVARTKSERRR